MDGGVWLKTRNSSPCKNMTIRSSLRVLQKRFQSLKESKLPPPSIWALTERRQETMAEFRDCFNERGIVQQLARIRMKEAGKRHEKELFHRIGGTAKQLAACEIFKMTPPRREWHSFRPRRHRQNVNNGVIFRQFHRYKSFHF